MSHRDNKTHEDLVCEAREEINNSARDRQTQQALFKNLMLKQLYPSQASLHMSSQNFETPRVDVSQIIH